MPDVPPIVEPILSPLQSLLYSIAQVFLAAMGWVKDVADVVVDHPILLIGVVVCFVGLGVGLFRRLLRV